MIRKDCPNCEGPSYSACSDNWICPYCGTDLTDDPELPAERRADNE